MQRFEEFFTFTDMTVPDMKAIYRNMVLCDTLPNVQEDLFETLARDTCGLRVVKLAAKKAGTIKRGNLKFSDTQALQSGIN
jgi:hypothetical protein